MPNLVGTWLAQWRQSLIPVAHPTLSAGAFTIGGSVVLPRPLNKPKLPTPLERLDQASRFGASARRRLYGLVLVGLASCFGEPVFAADISIPVYQFTGDRAALYGVLNSALVPGATDCTFDAGSYATFAAAITTIGATPGTLCVGTTQAITTAVTVPATLRLLVGGTGQFTQGGAGTLAINGPLSAPITLIFSGFTTGQITFGQGAMTVVYTPWWGAATAAADATNATAFQAAVDSKAPWVLTPSGDYAFDTGLSIDRAVHFCGMAGPGADSNATGQPGLSTTRFLYTGTATAMTLVGSGTEGKENIHLCDFALWGSASADDGILLGSSVLVTKGSVRNVQVRGFTKAGKLGLRYGKVLEFDINNVYLQSNYDGHGNVAGDVATTIRGLNVISRTNARFGTSFEGTYTGSVMVGLINEGNVDAGMRLFNSGVQKDDWVSYYSEGNNTASGSAPLIITGTATAPAYLNFFGGSFADAVGGRSITLDYAQVTSFYNVTLTTYNAGFMTATANTIAVDFYTWADNAIPASVTGNTANGVRIHTGGVISGGSNAGVGRGAFLALTSGTDDTALGDGACNTLTTGVNTTCLGNGAVPSGATVSNEFTLGDSSVTVLRFAGTPSTLANIARYQAGTCTLNGGATATCTFTVAYTSVGSFFCTATDSTAAAVSAMAAVNTNATTVTVTSGLTLDVSTVSIVCQGT